MKFFARNYDRLILGHPWIVLGLLAVVTVVMALGLPRVRLDASADSLVLEGDRALETYRDVAQRFGSSEFLVVSYRPFDDLMSAQSLARIDALTRELADVPHVQSVTSLLDVPLLYSPRIPFTELNDAPRTLRMAEVDREAAREELRTSPLYGQLVLGEDGQTTAIQVTLERDLRYEKLLEEREGLRALDRRDQLTPDQAGRLTEVEKEFKAYSVEVLERQGRYVEQVRAILDGYRSEAEIFLGGVPMIAVDMIAFVKNDLVVFGVAILIFIVVLLAAIFRSVVWVLLPLATCLCSAVIMLGMLAWLDWRMTVISSNFVALLLILTLSIAIHLVVRYRELRATRQDDTQRELVRDTVAFMARPCTYTTLTTMVAFASLVVSAIKPVIDFGWMMTIGVGMALVLSFLIMPCALVLLPRHLTSGHLPHHKPFTVLFARVIDRNGETILAVSALLLILSVLGISRLQVENRFIDYFDSDTEIYQGMVTIDRELGGTIPLSIVIRPEQLAPPANLAPAEGEDGEDEFADDFSDDFEDDFAAPKAASSSRPISTWFTTYRLSRLEQIHDHLDAMPETGKVLSLATVYKLGKDLMGGSVDDIQLAVAYKNLSDPVREVLVDPYLDTDTEQTLVSVRVMETSKGLRRGEFLERVRRYLIEDVHLQPENFEMTGMLVLYNNMLQSLYKSQILTLGAVFAVIMVMFLVLFRSVSLSLLAIAPNLLAAGTVLGGMGLFGVPLDMMTITIAAIVVGIGVDNAIHYVHRYRREFAIDGDYHAAMYRCHGSIGRAMYYTSVTIIAGFSMLALSNFRPSIYFGLLTAMAMLAALAGALLLLPRLILLFRPLGPGNAAETGNTVDE